MLLKEEMELIGTKYNPNFIVVEKYITDKLIACNRITKIAESKNGNIYYSINEKPDNALMRVKDEKCILIDRKFVELLAYYSFCINNKGHRERVIWNVPEKLREELGATQLVIEYMNICFNKYGKLVNLRSKDDVHHKSYTHDMRVLSVELLSKKEHFDKNSGSHMVNKYINTIEGFNDFVKNIDANKNIIRIKRVAA